MMTDTYITTSSSSNSNEETDSSMLVQQLTDIMIYDNSNRQVNFILSSSDDNLTPNDNDNDINSMLSVLNVNGNARGFEKQRKGTVPTKVSDLKGHFQQPSTSTSNRPPVQEDVFFSPPALGGQGHRGGVRCEVMPTTGSAVDRRRQSKKKVLLRRRPKPWKAMNKPVHSMDKDAGLGLEEGVGCNTDTNHHQVCFVPSQEEEEEEVVGMGDNDDNDNNRPPFNIGGYNSCETMISLPMDGMDSGGGRGSGGGGGGGGGCSGSFGGSGSGCRGSFGCSGGGCSSSFGCSNCDGSGCVFNQDSLSPGTLQESVLVETQKTADGHKRFVGMTSQFKPHTYNTSFTSQERPLVAMAVDKDKDTTPKIGNSNSNMRRDVIQESTTAMTTEPQQPCTQVSFQSLMEAWREKEDSIRSRETGTIKTGNARKWARPLRKIDFNVGLIKTAAEAPVQYHPPERGKNEPFGNNAPPLTDEEEEEDNAIQIMQTFRRNDNCNYSLSSTKNCSFENAKMSSDDASIMEDIREDKQLSGGSIPSDVRSSRSFDEDVKHKDTGRSGQDRNSSTFVDAKQPPRATADLECRSPTSYDTITKRTKSKSKKSSKISDARPSTSQIPKSKDYTKGQGHRNRAMGKFNKTIVPLLLLKDRYSVAEKVRAMVESYSEFLLREKQLGKVGWLEDYNYKTPSVGGSQDGGKLHTDTTTSTPRLNDFPLKEYTDDARRTKTSRDIPFGGRNRSGNGFPSNALGRVRTYGNVKKETTQSTKAEDQKRIGHGRMMQRPGFNMVGRSKQNRPGCLDAKSTPDSRTQFGSKQNVERKGVASGKRLATKKTDGKSLNIRQGSFDNSRRHYVKMRSEKLKRGNMDTEQVSPDSKDKNDLLADQLRKDKALPSNTMLYRYFNSIRHEDFGAVLFNEPLSIIEDTRPTNVVIKPQTSLTVVNNNKKPPLKMQTGWYNVDFGLPPNSTVIKERLPADPSGKDRTTTQQARGQTKPASPTTSMSAPFHTGKGIRVAGPPGISKSNNTNNKSSAKPSKIEASYLGLSRSNSLLGTLSQSTVVKVSSSLPARINQRQKTNHGAARFGLGRKFERSNFKKNDPAKVKPPSSIRVCNRRGNNSHSMINNNRVIPVGRMATNRSKQFSKKSEKNNLKSFDSRKNRKSIFDEFHETNTEDNAPQSRCLKENRREWSNVVFKTRNQDKVPKLSKTDAKKYNRLGKEYKSMYSPQNADPDFECKNNWPLKISQSKQYNFGKRGSAIFKFHHTWSKAASQSSSSFSFRSSPHRKEEKTYLCPNSLFSFDSNGEHWTDKPSPQPPHGDAYTTRKRHDSQHRPYREDQDDDVMLRSYPSHLVVSERGVKDNTYSSVDSITSTWGCANNKNPPSQPRAADTRLQKLDTAQNNYRHNDHFPLPPPPPPPPEVFKNATRNGPSRSEEEKLRQGFMVERGVHEQSCDSSSTMRSIPDLDSTESLGVAPRPAKTNAKTTQRSVQPKLVVATSKKSMKFSDCPGYATKFRKASKGKIDVNYSNRKLQLSVSDPGISESTRERTSLMTCEASIFNLCLSETSLSHKERFSKKRRNSKPMSNLYSTHLSNAVSSFTSNGRRGVKQLVLHRKNINTRSACGGEPYNRYHDLRTMSEVSLDTSVSFFSVDHSTVAQKSRSFDIESPPNTSPRKLPSFCDILSFWETMLGQKYYNRSSNGELRGWKRVRSPQLTQNAKKYVHTTTGYSSRSWSRRNWKKIVRIPKRIEPISKGCARKAMMSNGKTGPSGEHYFQFDDVSMSDSPRIPSNNPRLSSPTGRRGTSSTHYDGYYEVDRKQQGRLSFVRPSTKHRNPTSSQVVKSNNTRYGIEPMPSVWCSRPRQDHHRPEKSKVRETRRKSTQPFPRKALRSSTRKTWGYRYHKDGMSGKHRSNRLNQTLGDYIAESCDESLVIDNAEGFAERKNTEPGGIFPRLERQADQIILNPVFHPGKSDTTSGTGNEDGMDDPTKICERFQLKGCSSKRKCLKSRMLFTHQRYGEVKRYTVSGKDNGDRDCEREDEMEGLFIISEGLDTSPIPPSKIDKDRQIGNNTIAYYEHNEETPEPVVSDEIDLLHFTSNQSPTYLPPGDSYAKPHRKRVLKEPPPRIREANNNIIKLVDIPPSYLDSQTDTQSKTSATIVQTQYFTNNLVHASSTGKSETVHKFYQDARSSYYNGRHAPGGGCIDGANPRRCHDSSRNKDKEHFDPCLTVGLSPSKSKPRRSHHASWTRSMEFDPCGFESPEDLNIDCQIPSSDVITSRDSWQRAAVDGTKTSQQQKGLELEASQNSLLNSKEVSGLATTEVDVISPPKAAAREGTDGETKITPEIPLNNHEKPQSSGFHGYELSKSSLVNEANDNVPIVKDEDNSIKLSPKANKEKSSTKTTKALSGQVLKSSASEECISLSSQDPSSHYDKRKHRIPKSSSSGSDISHRNSRRLRLAITEMLATEYRHKSSRHTTGKPNARPERKKKRENKETAMPMISKGNNQKEMIAESLLRFIRRDEKKREKQEREAEKTMAGHSSKDTSKSTDVQEVPSKTRKGRDVEIVLGKDVSVDQFLTCFLGGLKDVHSRKQQVPGQSNLTQVDVKVKAPNEKVSRGKPEAITVPEQSSVNSASKETSASSKTSELKSEKTCETYSEDPTRGKPEAITAQEQSSVNNTSKETSTSSKSSELKSEKTCETYSEDPTSRSLCDKQKPSKRDDTRLIHDKMIKKQLLDESFRKKRKKLVVNLRRLFPLATDERREVDDHCGPDSGSGIKNRLNRGGGDLDHKHRSMESKRLDGELATELQHVNRMIHWSSRDRRFGDEYGDKIKISTSEKSDIADTFSKRLDVSKDRIGGNDEQSKEVSSYHDQSRTPRNLLDKDNLTRGTSSLIFGPYQTNGNDSSLGIGPSDNVISKTNEERLVAVHSENKPRLIEKGLAVEHSENQTGRIERDLAVDHSENQNGRNGRGLPVDHSENQTKRIERALAVDRSENKIKRIERGLAVDHSENQAKRAERGLAVDHSENQTRRTKIGLEVDHSENQTRRIGKGLAVDHSENHTRRIGRDLAVDHSENQTKRIERGLAVDRSENHTRRIERDLAVDHSENQTRMNEMSLKVEHSENQTRRNERGLPVDYSENKPERIKTGLAVDHSENQTKRIERSLAVEHSENFTRRIERSLAVDHSENQTKKTERDLEVEHSENQTRRNKRGLAVDRSENQTRMNERSLEAEHSEHHTRRIEKDWAVDHSKNQTKRIERSLAVDHSENHTRRIERGLAVDPSESQTKRIERSLAVDHSENQTKRTERGLAVNHSENQTRRIERDLAVDHSENHTRKIERDLAVDHSKNQTRMNERSLEVEHSENQTRRNERGLEVEHSKNQTRMNERSLEVEHSENQIRRNERGLAVDRSENQTKRVERGLVVDRSENQTKRIERGLAVNHSEHQTRRIERDWAVDHSESLTRKIERDLAVDHSKNQTRMNERSLEVEHSENQTRRNERGLTVDRSENQTRKIERDLAVDHSENQTKRNERSLAVDYSENHTRKIERVLAVDRSENQTKRIERGLAVDHSENHTRKIERGLAVDRSENQTKRIERGLAVDHSENQTKRIERGLAVDQSENKTRRNKKGLAVDNSENQTRRNERGLAIDYSENQPRLIEKSTTIDHSENQIIRNESNWNNSEMIRQSLQKRDTSTMPIESANIKMKNSSMSPIVTLEPTVLSKDCLPFLADSTTGPFLHTRKDNDESIFGGVISEQGLKATRSFECRGQNQIQRTDVITLRDANQRAELKSSRCQRILGFTEKPTTQQDSVVDPTHGKIPVRSEDCLSIKVHGRQINTNKTDHTDKDNNNSMFKMDKPSFPVTTEVHSKDTYIREPSDLNTNGIDSLGRHSDESENGRTESRRRRRHRQPDENQSWCPIVSDIEGFLTDRSIRPKWRHWRNRRCNENRLFGRSGTTPYYPENRIDQKQQHRQREKRSVNERDMSRMQQLLDQIQKELNDRKRCDQKISYSYSPNRQRRHHSNCGCFSHNSECVKDGAAPDAMREATSKGCCVEGFNPCPCPHDDILQEFNEERRRMKLEYIGSRSPDIISPCTNYRCPVECNTPCRGRYPALHETPRHSGRADTTAGYESREQDSPEGCRRRRPKPWSKMAFTKYASHDPSYSRCESVYGDEAFACPSSCPSHSVKREDSGYATPQRRSHSNDSGCRYSIPLYQSSCTGCGQTTPGQRYVWNGGYYTNSCQSWKGPTPSKSPAAHRSSGITLSTEGSAAGRHLATDPAVRNTDDGHGQRKRSGGDDVTRRPHTASRHDNSRQGGLQQLHSRDVAGKGDDVGDSVLGHSSEIVSRSPKPPRRRTSKVRNLPPSPDSLDDGELLDNTGYLPGTTKGKLDASRARINVCHNSSYQKETTHQGSQQQQQQQRFHARNSTYPERGCSKERDTGDTVASSRTRASSKFPLYIDPSNFRRWSKPLGQRRPQSREGEGDLQGDGSRYRKTRPRSPPSHAERMTHDTRRDGPLDADGNGQRFPDPDPVTPHEKRLEDPTTGLPSTPQIQKRGGDRNEYGLATKTGSDGQSSVGLSTRNRMQQQQFNARNSTYPERGCSKERETGDTVASSRTRASSKLPLYRDPSNFRRWSKPLGQRRPQSREGEGDLQGDGSRYRKTRPRSPPSHARTTLDADDNGQRFPDPDPVTPHEKRLEDPTTGLLSTPQIQKRGGDRNEYGTGISPITIGSEGQLSVELSPRRGIHQHPVGWVEGYRHRRKSYFDESGGSGSKGRHHKSSRDDVKRLSKRPAIISDSTSNNQSPPPPIGKQLIQTRSGSSSSTERMRRRRQQPHQFRRNIVGRRCEEDEEDYEDYDDDVRPSRNGSPTSPERTDQRQQQQQQQQIRPAPGGGGGGVEPRRRRDCFGSSSDGGGHSTSQSQSRSTNGNYHFNNTTVHAADYDDDYYYSGTDGTTPSRSPYPTGSDSSYRSSSAATTATPDSRGRQPRSTANRPRRGRKSSVPSHDDDYADNGTPPSPTSRDEWDYHVMNKLQQRTQKQGCRTTAHGGRVV